MSTSTSAIKASTSVRALAHRLNVDLTIVTPSGADGSITQADVQRVHRILTEVGPLELLQGPRRAMALEIGQAGADAARAHVTEDAVLQAWTQDQDFSLRLIRGIVAGCRAEPALNAWFDRNEIGRRVLPKIHLGVTIDTPEGQFVAVMQDVGNRDEASLRAGLEKMKAAADSRTIPPEELRGYTITLSNFGKLGGRYAAPVITPPTVAVVSVGAMREAVVPVAGQVCVSRVLPLSVTFDHRAVTGGEAARFLVAMVRDLERAA